ncbi:translation initiation factor eIF2B subunit beta-like isoform X1 [Scylla paramamosain]|uniref:translation initiation factor eIF2B subunit beta-like isoform X1 n=1 Tax=Scylla paramamosain TaxID=85552 RepID=UPI003083183B
MCPLVLAFLTKAATQRKFHVIVAERAPKYDGHPVAKALCTAGIETTLIQDSAVFPIMSRVNKVIKVNGGIETFVGAASLASPPKFYSVPLYVRTPTYKFSLMGCEEISHQTTTSIIPEGTKFWPSVNTALTQLDYVPPENVTSLITNNRGTAPSYVYRQLSELYPPTSCVTRR